MTITGIITKCFEIESRDNWTKASFILTSDDKYKTETKISVLGQNRIDSLQLNLGEKVCLEGIAESKEFNGRYYTEILIFRRINN